MGTLGVASSAAKSAAELKSKSADYRPTTISLAVTSRNEQSITTLLILTLLPLQLPLLQLLLLLPTTISTTIAATTTSVSSLTAYFTEVSSG